jgi:hypothetical protein
MSCNPLSIIRSSVAGWVAPMPPARPGQYPRAQPLTPNTDAGGQKAIPDARNGSPDPARSFVTAWRTEFCGEGRRLPWRHIVVLIDRIDDQRSEVGTPVKIPNGTGSEVPAGRTVRSAPVTMPAGRRVSVRESGYSTPQRQG